MSTGVVYSKMDLSDSSSVNSCIHSWHTSSPFSLFLSLSVDKSEEDVEREAQLLECRLTLTEERNTVLLPPAGSGIPGAPAHW